jgi:hypothetical protein
VWAEDTQRARCVASLVEDGLVVATSAETFDLP